MRIRRLFLLIGLTVAVLIVLGIISFFTATNWVSLTIKGPWQPQAATITPESAITTGLPGIKCKLTNYSVRPVDYGTDFSIEKWVEDRWEPVPVPEGFRFALGISVVMPFSSSELIYPTGWFTQSSGDGLYRIVQNVWVGDAKNANKHALYREFSVENDEDR